MNEVNIKYWFRNFQKNFFYRFSGRITTFYRRKTDLYEKKNFRRSACRRRLPRKVWLPTSTLSVQLRDFCFWIRKWFGPQSILLIFGLREQIPSGSSHTNFWLLFHFLVKYWPILLFLGLIWCKILCWAQKSILYGVKSRIGSLWSPKTKFVGHEFFISRVTYPSIRNFMLSSKKYTLWGLKCNRESWRPKYVKF
jgi:hypothetical protein